MPDVAAVIGMGGYAAYVWSAYGVTALVLGILVAASLRARRNMRASLAEAERAAPRRRMR